METAQGTRTKGVALATPHCVLHPLGKIANSLSLLHTQEGHTQQIRTLEMRHTNSPQAATVYRPHIFQTAPSHTKFCNNFQVGL